MEKQVQIGNPPITVTLRRSARARRYGLRVAQKDAKVYLTVPPRGTVTDATAFARQHEGWLRKHLAAVVAPQLPQFGDAVPVDGRPRTIVEGQGRHAVLDGDEIRLPSGTAQLSARLRAFYKLRARDLLVPASAHYAALIGREFGRVSLRDTRSRWGSCTSDGNLMFSWRLAMAPREVLDYVAAHEVCHLQEMNHGPAFWALVAKVCPDYRVHRDWLRKNGASLHLVRI